ncbi:VOC family protein [Kitasatospora purpeofusca]|uniref:VOC family protein n=1 Tax=Kitasatospora purpeofusca TaxID=67352 RepID=UPI002254714B|nr:VOC family protein [Kitasatospora purpeofusca]MCX4687522.1 glyoxalase [Kitasatospora purpeofusca]
MTSGFTFERLHHVQLDIPAGAEDECRAFWHGVLGMTELTKPPVLAARGGCWFRGGGVEVHLGVVPEFRPSRKGHPGFRVGGLDALAERLAAHGHEVVWDDHLPGHRRFHSSDRLGNRLEFLEPSPAAADA